MNEMTWAAEPEATTVSQLKPGDFVMEIRQPGYRPATINSGLATISEPGFRGWYAKERYGRRLLRRDLLSQTMTFLDRSLGAMDLPEDTPVLARPLLAGGPLPLEDQVARLQAGYEAACAETAAEQGDAIVDGGGWLDIARAIIDLAGDEISEQAKAEFARRNGIEPARR